MSDFQHFHWLTGHKLSVHIPALPNVWLGNASSIRELKTFLQLREKNDRQNRFGPE